MKPKICIIIPEYRSSTATHFNYLCALIENLQKETNIFLIVERGDRPDFLKNGKVYVQKTRFLPVKLIENLFIIWLARLGGYKDFYIHYSFFSAFNASLAVKALGGRTFYWNCGLPWFYRRNFFREKFERLAYRLVTFLVTGTEGLKKEYARHYHLPADKIKVMPNWIDAARFRVKPENFAGIKSRLNISSGQKVVLFTHHLSRRKGAHYLPEILKRLTDAKLRINANDAKDFVLIIIGDGPERENIESRIRNYELWDKARFLGSVPNKEIQDYFGAADLFILPSEEEGFPHVLLEAMASGTPFVAFDVGGVREIVPPEFSEYLVASGNLDGFAEKIKELLHADPKNLEALKQSELNWVRQFDLKLAAERFKNMLC